MSVEIVALSALAAMVLAAFLASWGYASWARRRER